MIIAIIVIAMTITVIACARVSSEISRLEEREKDNV